MTDHDDEAPGWDALDAAAEALYGAQSPHHVSYQPGLHFGSGLQGCSAYDAGDHWHYLTYGLTELWGKEDGSDPSWSGWGYEMTMRVRKDGGTEPPAWPFNLLETIARYTHNNSTPFPAGDRLSPGGPITGEPSSALTALAFWHDAQLAPISTPSGRVEFRMVLGITAAELEQMKSSSTEAVITVIQGYNPLLITDPTRPA